MPVCLPVCAVYAFPRFSPKMVRSLGRSVGRTFTAPASRLISFMHAAGLAVCMMLPPGTYADSLDKDRPGLHLPLIKYSNHAMFALNSSGEGKLAAGRPSLWTPSPVPPCHPSPYVRPLIGGMPFQLPLPRPRPGRDYAAKRKTDGLAKSSCDRRPPLCWKICIAAENRHRVMARSHVSWSCNRERAKANRSANQQFIFRPSVELPFAFGAQPVQLVHVN